MNFRFSIQDYVRMADIQAQRLSLVLHELEIFFPVSL